MCTNYWWTRIYSQKHYSSEVLIGINFRELKPENILVDHNKIIKFVDFGLSNTYNNEQIPRNSSASYTAPEIVLGKKYSGLLVDIWSVGVTLYAMVCGSLPFEVIPI